MKNRIVTLCFIFDVMLSGPACSGLPKHYSAEAIEGSVVDAETKKPLEGAVVTAQSEQRYKTNAGNEFATAVATEIKDFVFIEPPLFYLGRSEKNSFVMYGKEAKQYEQVKCERAVSFEIVADASVDGGISAGVCTQEAKRLRELAASANQKIDMFIDQLLREGARTDKEQLSKLGWVFEKKKGPNQSEIYYFSIIAVGHGVSSFPTAVLVSKNGDRAIIVQAVVINLCKEGLDMSIKSVLCIDTKGAIVDIAKRLFARFGEQ